MAVEDGIAVPVPLPERIIDPVRWIGGLGAATCVASDIRLAVVGLNADTAPLASPDRDALAAVVGLSAVAVPDVSPGWEVLLVAVAPEVLVLGLGANPLSLDGRF